MRFVLIALAVVLASCSSGTEGIFASIEREQKVVSLGGLNKNSTLTHVTEFGSRYYAAGGQALFSRSTTAGTVKWDKGTVGGSSRVAAVEAIGTNLFAVAGGTLYVTTDGNNWTTVDLGGKGAFDLIPIRVSTGGTVTELLVATSDGNQDSSTVYRIDNSGTLSSALVLPLPSGLDVNLLSSPVSAATMFNSQYYFLNESHLWRVDAGFTAATLLAPTVLPASMSGLLAEGGRLFASTKGTGAGGGLYYTTETDDDPQFTAIASDFKDDSDDPVQFGTLFYNAKNTSLWVGTLNAISGALTEGYGYGEITALGTTPSFDLDPNTDSNNYTSADVSKSIVSSFFYSATNAATHQEYFLGTSSHGLWLWNSSAKTWSQQ